MKQSDSPTGFDVDNGLLLAYIEGAVDLDTRKRIEDRLAADPKLRAEAESLAEMQRALERGLREEFGPTTQELGEYALGLMPSDEATALEGRFAADPMRRAEVERLRRYLAGPPLPEFREADTARAGRISTIVAELVEGLARLGGTGPAAAPLGVRGAEAAPAVYRAGDAELVLEVQTAPGPARVHSLFGLLVGFEGPESLTAALFRGDETVGSAACDELGNFVLGNVTPGRYDLVLRGPETEILVPGLAVE